MGDPIGEDAWRQLLDSLLQQHRRRAGADPEKDPLIPPKAGATEQQLRAAERRLGFRLDPQYREFLSIADGWDGYNFGEDLLGTSDLGSGPRWDEAVESLHWFVDDIGPDAARSLRIPDDYADSYLPIADRLCLALKDTSQGAAGSIFSLYIDWGGIWPDLSSYLKAELRQMTYWTDQKVLGPHSETWGRDIRIAPPTLTDILTKILDLSATAYPDQPIQANPGAAPNALNALDHDFAGALHPEHRELLAITDGLSTPEPMLGHVLSVDDIREGTRWQTALACAQKIEDDYFGNLAAEAARTGQPPPPPKPPVRERILRIPVVPFSVLDGRVYGIDTHTGQVRELLDDAFIPGAFPGYAISYGTVRQHLLTVCDHLRGLSIANRGSHKNRTNDGCP
ncbi:SMI1/KNR4 family protein [Nocardia sp. NPDC088792]|uniref:SMI1/KNR4 family protein n=1 Tax=Nocardia sp. NPDC088792 TaxID=3364332 RepID=UPI003811D599